MRAPVRSHSVAPAPRLGVSPALRLPVSPSLRFSVSPSLRLSVSPSLLLPVSPSLLLRILALTLTLALLVAARPARAFNFTGVAWPDGTVTMRLQLGPTPALSDGAADWADVAESALAEWNTQLARTRFASTRGTGATPTVTNRTNDVVFASTIYGQAFDSRTLAVTLGDFDDDTLAPRELDVIFNSNRTWNSYRGAVRSGVVDFRRVALHEFGHVLGLDHPDEAEPFQNVGAIMESAISSTESLRADDIAGVKALYDQTPGRTVAVGQPLVLGLTTASTISWTYNWFFRPAGSHLMEPFRLPSGPSYTLGAAQLADAGTYVITATSPAGTFLSNTVIVATTPVPLSPAARLANLSTRGVVGTGGDIMIAGFVIGGTEPKTMLVRAAGPALAGFGVAGALADPVLTLRNSANVVVAANDNWETSANLAALSAASARLGAFAFPAGSRDAAVLVTLPPGSYTAAINGAGDTTGNALVEVYDADSGAISASRRLVNLATRGPVRTGDDVLIAGLVVSGPGPRTYLIRAVGPTLARAPFNFAIRSVLIDPFLQLYRGNTLLRENDDLDAPYGGIVTLRAAGDQVGAFRLLERRIPPRESGLSTNTGLDSVMLVTLEPGSYTAKVSGFEGATGVALIEVYELP